MIVDFKRASNIYLIQGTHHFKRHFDSLVAMVEYEYKMKLDEDSVFLVCGSDNSEFCAFYFDGEGIVSIVKRFDQGSLFWPRSSQGIIKITEQQLDLLLSGYPIEPKVKPSPRKA
ncbi:IS66 family insertion sequence element accessory protein TnpB [Fundicoccus culcitae]|uniref:IS66 family insertion sequence element accessory protein TnpB n=1 Tax=Fundicoccus culcitae TaxID=2969821 RepID=A0ABY5P9Y3_9LACT|nr:IS66 family insertion sequence element accessory protein TnpB [Fundicoccus culcitae]UUX35293.1 IS66 family insertion sequence element accessory protein TnpB [Fundicoccus culcitae]UUX35339.1 IS66 family insertion sequence element accessory protein TnpB [Fundicoccus culcitae]